jgi:G3E family GTPase
MKKMPVHIITGFLGSGKTTFLNHLIQNRPSERVLVIENECGDTNIDGGLIIDQVKEIIELSAGCLCCSLSKELIGVLLEIKNNLDRYDRLIIETTGIADPSSILQTFLENPNIEENFDLQQIICLTDASLIEEWLKHKHEALKQISISDCILINKVDLIPNRESIKIENLIQNINPNAFVFIGSNGDFPIDDIFSIGTTKAESVESLQHLHHSHHEYSTDKNNSHNITSFTLTFTHPLDLERLTVELDRIVNLYRHQVYRVKGYIAIPNYPNRVILQSARNIFITTDGSPWESEHDRIGKLVFIGVGLKQNVFEKIFYRYMVKS